MSLKPVLATGDRFAKATTKATVYAQSTGPLWLLLQVVLPGKGEPKWLFRAEHGQALLVEHYEPSDFNNSKIGLQGTHQL